VLWWHGPGDRGGALELDAVARLAQPVVTAPPPAPPRGRRGRTAGHPDSANGPPATADRGSLVRVPGSHADIMYPSLPVLTADDELAILEEKSTLMPQYECS
jgi:hypothetical protein